jgi:hypothetical protein
MRYREWGFLLSRADCRSRDPEEAERLTKPGRRGLDFRRSKLLFSLPQAVQITLIVAADFVITWSRKFSPNLLV